MGGRARPSISLPSSGPTVGSFWVESPTTESVIPVQRADFLSQYRRGPDDSQEECSRESISPQPLPDFEPSTFRRLSDDEELQTLFPPDPVQHSGLEHIRTTKRASRLSTASNRFSTASQRLGVASLNLNSATHRFSAFTERQIRQLEAIVGEAVRRAVEENPLEFARRALGENSLEKIPGADPREEKFESVQESLSSKDRQRYSLPFAPIQRHSSTQRRLEGVSVSLAKHNRVPDGGVRAWSVAVGGFLTYFATFGLLNSFGTFQTYYATDLLAGTSQSTIAWIGSIQLFLLFSGGMIVGPAFDKFGARPIMIPGTLIYVLSLMFTSLCTRYYQLLLAQGILYGIGDAMLFYPTISAVSHWFDRKRGLALGIAVSGSSIGGICWPIMLQRVIASVGFGWTVRIAGFMCLGLLLPATWLIKERRDFHEHNQPPDMKRILRGMIKEKSYIVLTLAFFFVFWGMFLPFYYLPIYGLSHGMSNSMSNYTLTFLNAGSFVGRVGSGIMADKFGSLNITVFCATSAGIVLMCLHSITSGASIIVFSIIYGALSGGLISLQSACVAQMTLDLGAIGIRIGVLMAVCSFGVLTGSPIGGALVTRGWGPFIDFAGVILLFGALLMIVARLVAQPKVSSAF